MGQRYLEIWPDGYLTRYQTNFTPTHTLHKNINSNLVIDELSNWVLRPIERLKSLKRFFSGLSNNKNLNTSFIFVITQIFFSFLFAPKESRFFSSFTHIENKIFIKLSLEFDPGSERLLVLSLIHASGMPLRHRVRVQRKWELTLLFWLRNTRIQNKF